MQVSIDWKLCIGSGRCVARSPEAFALVESDGETRALLVAPGQDDEALLEAARTCPTLAIRVADGEGKRLYPASRS